jgi:hypothetical protein
MNRFIGGICASPTTCGTSRRDTPNDVKAWKPAHNSLAKSKQNLARMKKKKNIEGFPLSYECIVHSLSRETRIPLKEWRRGGRMKPDE